jgi:L-ascorbate metabolism protein UlaG (beta-lactamase superfamily)
MLKISILLITLISLVGCITYNSNYKFKEEIYYKGPVSDHFNSKRFIAKTYKSTAEIAKFLLTPRPNWKESLPYDENIKSSNEIKKSAKTKVTFIGHSTLLIQIENSNILTDPIWSDYAGPINLLSPKRVNKTPFSLESLPKISHVLISHNHYDHMDIPTIKKLKKLFNPLFITGLGNCYYLNNKKNLAINCIEMDWNEIFKISDNLAIYFLEAKHWSKRSLFDTNKTLWGSFAIASKDFKIYFAGDSGYDDHFKKIGLKFNGFDLALLPIGAYQPIWFMKDNHINPKQALQAHLDLKAKKSIAIHYKTFPLGMEDYFDPIIDLQEAKSKEELNNIDFALPAFGEKFYF